MTIRSVRFTRLLLVLLLAFSVCVHSSHAMLAEMVVGAGMFYQAFEVIGVLLPQLAALGTSMVALAAVGRQVATSFKSFLKAFFPKQDGDQVVASPSPGASPAPASGSVPDIAGPADTPTASPSPDASPAPSPSPAASPAPSASPSATPSAPNRTDLASRTTELVRVYHQRMEGQNASTAGAPAAASSDAGQLEARYEDLSGQVTGALLETIADGDTAAYDQFAQQVKSLDRRDLPALQPVLTQAARRGVRFGQLHHDGGETGNFARLKALRDMLFPPVGSGSGMQSHPAN